MKKGYYDIGARDATMLGLLLTDAPLFVAAAQQGAFGRR